AAPGPAATDAPPDPAGLPEGVPSASAGSKVPRRASPRSERASWLQLDRRHDGRQAATPRSSHEPEIQADVSGHGTATTPTWGPPPGGLVAATAPPRPLTRWSRSAFGVPGAGIRSARICPRRDTHAGTASQDIRERVFRIGGSADQTCGYAPSYPRLRF